MMSGRTRGAGPTKDGEKVDLAKGSRKGRTKDGSTGSLSGAGHAEQEELDQWSFGWMAWSLWSNLEIG